MKVTFFFGQKFPAEKRKSEMVHCRDATASSFVTKIRGEIFAHFQAVKVTVVCGTGCLACQGNFL
jgi:hypothetical protein